MRHSVANDIATISRISAVPAILQVITESTGLGFAAIARVTESSWTACAVLDNLSFGLKPGGELELTSTICHEIRSSHQPVVIDHVAKDALFCEHHTPRLYNFQSYISVPVFLTNGSFFGTICALDPKPAKLIGTPVQAMMESFARLLALQIEAEESMQQVQADLLAEREVAELREQFIAVLGHDLRNPLFAITASAELLQRRMLDDKACEIVQHILRSGKRASQLVDDVLDFARGRMGHGIPLSIHDAEGLDKTLEHVVSEIQRVHPSRVIESDIGMLERIRCDHERIAQMLSNLVSNAITHGDAHSPVQVAAEVQGELFLLSVTNQGEPIPESIRSQLFLPYSRPVTDEPQAGLGLGLYIANEIALAHGGTLSVCSTRERGTIFTFSMPLKSA
ncbi:ATP-binding protein [Pseudomonas syringae]|uniref:histidine kinase n=1 Tax=Pseudomonas syringae TaxID=317 RepID=A0A9Q4A4T0_PSESX|nr:ATP-binding protein [Pseudomonas syringae]KTB86243.1 histidine kinase [Pseudomonas syringae pv. syringae PD2766]MCF5468325.1 GAF domain-containing protein [Pseudomonas syringae]MCF5472897.1 GAF domain-containing protein [Pseudomonas syringae]MCF5482912.1 GAF domain-containing protein [Pseudomonas syringae]MCF5489362.1 GAF domain-containing protein [Pseudomonas syringae]